MEDTVAGKSSALSPAPISIDVDLCGVKDALNAFKAFLNYLYGGQLDIAVADADSVSRYCQFFLFYSIFDTCEPNRPRAQALLLYQTAAKVTVLPLTVTFSATVPLQTL